jgi:hypothetical protein
MSKIDTQFAAIEAGFQDPELRFGTAWVQDEQMEQLGVRRKKAGQPKHRLFYLSVGEAGQAPVVTFWGNKFSDCLIKALSWRNLPTKSKRGPKAQQPAAS